MNLITKFIKFWSQIWTIPIGLLMFYFSPYLIHYLDETAEVLTIGQIQKIIFVIAGLFIVDGLVWMLIWLNFPALYNTYKNNYGHIEGLNQLTPWEKRKYILSLLALYFFAEVFIALAEEI